MTTSIGYQEADPTSPAAPKVFARVLVGIDPSAESREAVRQATWLIGERGELMLLAAYEPVYPAAVSGLTISDDFEQPYEDEARKALEHARLDAAREDVPGKVVRRRAADALLEEAERTEATLIAVGSHGHGRAAGILLGSVATEIVHRAPCSVLGARRTARRHRWTIVVGLDGSPESMEAYAAAADLAARTGAELWPVVAEGGKPVDRSLVDAVVSHYETSPDGPVRALRAAAADADLVVVGSRGLHGLKALGSVSERVAHEAACSALIVRCKCAKETRDEGEGTDVGARGERGAGDAVEGGRRPTGGPTHLGRARRRS